MEQRVSVITLQVADLARSRAFYRSLGWRTAGPDMDDVAFLNLNGLVLSLYAHQDRDAGLEGVGAGDAASPRVGLGHNVRERGEIEPALAAFEAGGGRVVRPAHDTDWGGRTAYAADPDGHLWEIAWNPAWPVAADGAVQARFD